MRELLTALQLGALLMLFQGLGESVVRINALPLSGPVAGMIFLFVYLCLRGGLPARLQNATTAALRHMSLLFIPAGAGLMLYLGMLREQWQIIIAAIVGGTVCTLTVAALSLHAFRALQRRDSLAES